MAKTLISDVFIEEVYGDMTTNNRVDKLAFAQSGIIVRNPELQRVAESGARIVEIPHWNDLSEEEPNISDDSDDEATPKKITTGSLMGRNAYLNQAWSSADLAAEIGGRNPMQAIKDRTGAYWQLQFQKRLIAMTRGILADNIAANSGDMLYNVALETLVGQTDDNKISADVLIEGLFTLGDRFDTIGAIAMHSIPYKNLVKQNQIEFIRPSEGSAAIPTYLGKIVVVDDGMPAIAGTTSGVKYVTAMFGSGAFGYGEGTPVKPTAVVREELKGNGGGVETLVDRVTWLLHPKGYNFDSASVAGESASLAELMLAANWSRVLPRKKIPVAFVQTNG